MRELRFLQALGLLEIDTFVWIRPVLARCLASAVAEASILASREPGTR